MTPVFKWDSRARGRWRVLEYRRQDWNSVLSLLATKHKRLEDEQGWV